MGSAYNALIDGASHAESAALFEAILGLRHMFNRSCGYTFRYRDLADRCCIKRFNFEIGGNSVPAVACVVFNCIHMLFDGLGMPDCKHGGKAKGGQDRYHGTKDLQGVLASNGVFTAATNTCLGKRGWFHTEHLSMALGYANSMHLGRARFKPIFKVHCMCFNALGQRQWHYTKHDCKRYAVQQIILVPCSRVDCCNVKNAFRKRVARMRGSVLRMRGCGG